MNVKSFSFILQMSFALYCKPLGPKFYDNEEQFLEKTRISSRRDLSLHPVFVLGLSASPY